MSVIVAVRSLTVRKYYSILVHWQNSQIRFKETKTKSYWLLQKIQRTSQNETKGHKMLSCCLRELNRKFQMKKVKCNLNFTPPNPNGSACTVLRICCKNVGYSLTANGFPSTSCTAGYKGIIRIKKPNVSTNCSCPHVVSLLHERSDCFNLL